MKRSLIVLLVLAGLLAGGISVATTGPEEKAKEELDKVVQLGRSLFLDRRLGSNAKWCASCHEDEEKPNLNLATRVGDYPKYDRRERRVITLGMKINQMVEKMLKGEPEALDSERLVALEAYLMSISRK